MKHLIQQLIDEGYLKTPAIIKAFTKINRTDFLANRERDQNELEQESEINAPLPINYGQTISQPLTVAFMLELLQPQKGDKVLDVGSGSGWTACLLAELVGSTGQVIAIERLPKLKEFGEQNTKKYQFSNLQFIVGDGSKGYPAQSPYNKIHVAAAARKIPIPLIEQLIPGGQMVIPVGEGFQDMVLLTKSKTGKISKKIYPGFTFVPLVED